MLLKEDFYIPGRANCDALDMARGADVSASGFTEGNPAKNVISGVARAVGKESHVWESEKTNGTRWISLKLNNPKKIVRSE